MKYNFFFLFLFILLKSSAQNINAGEYDVNEYFYDFVPDYVLYAPEPVNFSSDSIFLDVNNDGIQDIILDVSNQDGGNWSNYKHAEIIPLNNCEVSFGTTDTCFATCPPPDYVSLEAIARAYDSLDLIDSSGIWIDSSSYLSFARWNATVPNVCGHMCDGGYFQSTYRYVGVRVFPAGDTLYGWVKLRVFGVILGDYNLAIDSYACNEYILGLDELNLPDKTLVKIVDVLGRETENKPNTLLIFQYADGTSRRVYRVE